MRRVVVLAVVCACGHAPPAATPRQPASIAVAGDRSILAFDLGGPVSGEPALCAPGLVLVPVGGGVRVAGISDWLVPPDDLPITGVGCGERQQLFLMLDGRRLVTFPDGLGTGKLSLRVTLPPGRFELLTAGDGTSWMWGHDAQGAGRVFRYRHHLREVWHGPSTIGAVAPVGANGLVIATAGQLVLLRADGGVVRLARLGFVDGLAVARNGTLYVSTRDGVLALQRDGAELRASWIARGVHGPLRLRGDALYVLWRAPNRLIRIAPRTPATS